MNNVRKRLKKWWDKKVFWTEKEVLFWSSIIPHLLGPGECCCENSISLIATFIVWESYCIPKTCTFCSGTFWITLKKVLLFGLTKNYLFTSVCEFVSCLSIELNWKLRDWTTHFSVATNLVSNNLEFLLFSNEFYRAECIEFYMVVIERLENA